MTEMKNIYIYLTLSVACLMVLATASSCKKSLEQSPLDEFDTRTFWVSEENAMLALNGVYRGNHNSSASQTPSSWWGYQAMIYLETATDNAYTGQGDNTVYHKLTNGTLTSNVGVLSDFWTASYRTIALANDFLENIDQVTAEESRKNRLKSEARFIRACQYFYLSQYFGSVPLVTKTLTIQEANTVTKAPKSEIISFIEDEFKACAPALPRYKDIPLSEMGRASEQAVLAFLGRLQLSEQRFSDAAGTYKKIIDYGDNIIDPDYSSIFLESNENSREHIFSFQLIPNLIPNPMMRQLAPRTIMAGTTLVNPLGSLVEAYPFIDGSPFSFTDPRYDPKDIGKNRDPRLRYTIYYDNAPFKGGKLFTHPDSVNSVDRISRFNSKTGFIVKKYIDENFGGNLNTDYGVNVPVIRYAEVLLSYLEAKLEAGDAIDQTLLNTTINRVRGRASVNMPAVTQTSPALLRPILRNERRIELTFEGIRLWDLLRWKIADQVLKGDFYGAAYPGAKTAPKKKSATTPADPYGRWYVTTRNFRKGIDETWPIPQSEVNINPGLAN